VAQVSSAGPAAVATAGGPPGIAGPPPDPPRRRSALPYLLLLPGLGWLALFFLVPVLTLAATSTQTIPPGAEVGVYEQSWRLANYVDALQAFWPQFARSFLYAGLATVLALAIGYPLAYAIAFKGGRWKNLLLVLVVAPFFTSFILRTIAWKQILADEFVVVRALNAALDVVGYDGQVRLTSTAVAVVSGLTYNFLPFMILPLYASLERLDPRLVEASGDLYASGPTTFLRVTFPLSMPGVVAGTLLTFIPAAGDFVNSALLGNRDTSMVGNVIDARFLRVLDYPTAAALSFVLMATILVLVGLYVRRAGTEELV